jgi:hypothetical protein
MNLRTIKFWATLLAVGVMWFVSHSELRATESPETTAVGAAQQYVQSMLTTCDDSAFVNDAGLIRESKGPVTPNGCREPPTPSFNDSGVSWSCGLQFKATRERIFTEANGWSAWGKSTPLVINIEWPTPASTTNPGQLKKLACSDIPDRSDPPKETSETASAGTAQRVRVNTPGDGFLALRSEPSTRRGSRLAKIPHGTTIELGDCAPSTGRGNWCRTRYDGKAGWVLDLYVVR